MSPNQLILHPRAFIPSFDTSAHPAFVGDRGSVVLLGVSDDTVDEVLATDSEAVIAVAQGEERRLEDVVLANTGCGFVVVQGEERRPEDMVLANTGCSLVVDADIGAILRFD